MDAKKFYQSQREGARSLRFISTQAWPNWPMNEQEKAVTQAQGFEARLGEMVFIYSAQGQLEHVWVGAGGEDYDQAMATAATKIPAGIYHCDQTFSEKALLLWSLAQYRFDAYRKSNLPVRCLALDQAQYTRITLAAEALFWVRDLINTPAQDMGPQGLVHASRRLAKEFGAQLEITEGDALEQHYPAIHAVGRAAAQAPCLIELHWGHAQHPRLALVGKGVCFDSGGLDLKNASGMRLMKKDMGGAAQVLGLARWIMAQNLPIRLHVLIPAVENAVSGNAYRPGDVLRMRNQLTVEIENTDAEGRLVMADALVKACESKPQLLMDFSTLTGAARIAVGSEISAMFSNDDDLAQALQRHADAVLDPIWRLPLYAPYLSMLDSSIADMMNASGSSYGGAITAALFLEKFVTEDIPWVHFDMMAWNMSNKPGRPEGGEAMAIRAVEQYLQAWCQRVCGK